MQSSAGRGVTGKGSQPPNITTEGRLTRTDEFQNIVVRANPDGSVVRVKDVAR